MPARLAEIIAAGEVIERPASAVKEMLENAVDAGATEIEISIVKGGKARIEVNDNGSGIVPQDLPLAIERHATSKIHDEKDLERIRTFGFRGEALASLAAAGELTIESRAIGSDHGMGLRTIPGQPVQDPYPVARATGTTVRFEKLFATVPARRKFLRTDATEKQRVRDIIRVFVIAHPEIGFRFVSDGRMVWNYAPSSLEDRLNEVYPDTPWLPVDLDAVRYRLTGLLSQPQRTHGNGSNIAVFVNRRFVRDPLLRKAVQNGYERHIPPGRWPIGAVFLDVLPEDIDVNVHPAKTEIRFVNPGGMFAEIRGAVRQAIAGHRTPPGRGTGDTNSAIVDPDRTGTVGTPADSPSDAAHYPSSASSARVFSMADARQQATVYRPDPGTLMDQSNLRPLGNLGQRYLLYIEGDSLVIVDQHAAHERVRYDRIVAALDSGDTGPIQELLVPDVFAAEPEELSGFRTGGDWLSRTGFLIESFGPETLRIRAVPQWFRGDPRPAVRETLTELARYKVPAAIEAEAHKVAASLACRGSILSGRNVSVQEQAELLKHLLDTPGADTCPHGRPTFRRMSVGELDRWFGR